MVAIKNAEPTHTVSCSTARASTTLLELENRCTGNRTEGSNPTLSARVGHPRLAYFSPATTSLQLLLLCAKRRTYGQKLASSAGRLGPGANLRVRGAP